MGIFKKSEEEIRLGEQRDALIELTFLPGWKIISNIMADVKDISVQMLDDKTLGDLTPNEAGYIKGMRDAINKIEKRIDFILNGR